MGSSDPAALGAGSSWRIPRWPRRRGPGDPPRPGSRGSNRPAAPGRPSWGQIVAVAPTAKPESPDLHQADGPGLARPPSLDGPGRDVETVASSSLSVEDEPPVDAVARIMGGTE